MLFSPFSNFRPYVRAFTDLDITFVDYPPHDGGLWKVLKEEGVQLHKLVTTLVTTDCYTYLRSYRGLTKLRLHGFLDHEDLKNEVDLEYVLGTHVDSLIMVAIRPFEPCFWCLNASFAPFVARCTKLERFKITYGLLSDKIALAVQVVGRPSCTKHYL
jgi:hypothetical protein